MSNDKKLAHLCAQIDKETNCQQLNQFVDEVVALLEAKKQEIKKLEDERRTEIEVRAARMRGYALLTLAPFSASQRSDGESLKRIAILERPILKTALEPLGALGGASVGETFGIDRSSGHSLQAIIADRGCGLQARIYVSRVEEVALLGGVSPDAGEAVGLKLKAD